MRADVPRADLVLVGGGHAHVQVIRAFAMRPLAGVRLSVVLDRAEAVYSGMVPGHVAGDYRAAELEIDVWTLARRAGARVVCAAATRVDPIRRRIELEGRPPIAYDVASLDVGSTLRGLDRPGVARHALGTRPIRDLVDRLDEAIDRADARASGRPLRVRVVGAGAAGVELAFALRARLERAGRDFDLALLGDGARPLTGASEALVGRVERALRRRGIAWQPDAEVEAVGPDALRVGGAWQPCDLALWATGAAPWPWLSASPLASDPAGFVRIRDTLQTLEHDDLFAVGDCAALDGGFALPKAGVYAVRQGPVLDANLRARLQGRPLRRYRPQRDFLALLNLGDGRALGGKWGVAFEGAWVWRWKDRIDRRFVERFQLLDEAGRPGAALAGRGGMDAEPMECGGCAAKLAAPALDAALARLGPGLPDEAVVLGLERPDDAAAVRMPGGDLLLASVDAFRAFGDDPWWVGRVAAVNALSDLYAKGGAPRFALAWVSVPDEDAARASETLFQVLAGVRAALDPLGVALVGGHSARGPELLVGLSVAGGLADGAPGPIPVGDLQAGDELVLTKALGTGVLLAADARGLVSGRRAQSLHEAMARANDAAARVARRAPARAATDVSGFGLARHLGGMLAPRALAAEVWLDRLPALPGALDLLAAGIRSTYHDQNAALAAALCGAPAAGPSPGPATELMFDPQTSGGLLLGLPAGRARTTLDALWAAGDSSARWIGRVLGPRGDGPAVRPILSGGGGE